MAASTALLAAVVSVVLTASLRELFMLVGRSAGAHAVAACNLT